MVVFRAFQGVSGAFIVPLAQATLFDINPREKHGQAMALFGGGVMIGPILGPVLGGWLTDNYNWRWVFLVNLPVGILCVLMMLRFMPKTETHQRKLRHVRLHFAGACAGRGCSCSSTAASRKTGCKLGNPARARLGDRRVVDVHRAHGDVQASLVRADDVRRPQLRYGPAVHGRDGRAAAGRPRAAAAAAPEHVRLFRPAVGFPDRAARRRHADFHARSRAGSTGKIDARILVGIGVVLMGVSLYMMTGFAIDQPRGR